MVSTRGTVYLPPSTIENIYTNFCKRLSNSVVPAPELLTPRDPIEKLMTNEQAAD